MPDTDVGTTTDTYQPEERVLVAHHATYGGGISRCGLPWHDDGSPVEVTIVRGPDSDRDYLVNNPNGGTCWVGQQFLSRPSGVTMTATSTPTVGQEMMLAVGATTTSGDGNFFGNTEPLLVTVQQPYPGIEDGDSYVLGADNNGETISQTVATRFLTPMPEPVAEDGSTPEWPVRLCEAGHRATNGVHYHVTEGSDTFQPEGRSFHNYTVMQRTDWATEQGVRYGNAEQVAEWVAAHPESSQPCDTVDPDAPLPPEEVLRIIRADNTLLHEYTEQVQTIESLLAQVVVARQAVDDARHERALWLDRLITRSREVARQQDWCGVYDAGMRELGLPGRHDAHEGVTVDDDDEDDEPVTEEITVTATIEISVNFDDGDFDSWFENLHGVSISSASNSTDFTFTIDVEHSVTVPEDECGCEQDIDWENVLPSYVRDSGYGWDVDRKECTND